MLDGHDVAAVAGQTEVAHVDERVGGAGHVCALVDLEILRASAHRVRESQEERAGERE